MRRSVGCVRAILEDEIAAAATHKMSHGRPKASRYRDRGASARSDLSYLVGSPQSSCDVAKRAREMVKPRATAG